MLRILDIPGAARAIDHAMCRHFPGAELDLSWEAGGAIGLVLFLASVLVGGLL